MTEIPRRDEDARDVGGTSALQRTLDAEAGMRPPRAAEPDMTPTWKAEGLSWRDWASTLHEIVEQVAPDEPPANA